MYARGFSNQNIYEEMQELYGVKVSPDMVTAITDKNHSRDKRMAEKTIRRTICNSICRCKYILM